MPYSPGKKQLFFCKYCGRGEVANHVVKSNVRHEVWNDEKERWVIVPIEETKVHCHACGKEMEWAPDGEWLCACGQWTKNITARWETDPGVRGLACPSCNYTIYLDRDAGLYYCECGSALVLFEVGE
ncbi:MAG TPA: hypothetical protein PKD55_00240 [Bellilinea sp.]|nr:hypothetical protein [Bellilinea sp.]